MIFINLKNKKNALWWYNYDIYKTLIYIILMNQRKEIEVL